MPLVPSAQALTKRLHKTRVLGEITEVESVVEVPPNDPPLPYVSSVSDTQASEGDPSGRPSEPMTTDSQPLFSAGEPSEQCSNAVNDTSNYRGNENIVTDKPCDSQSEVNESSSIAIKSGLWIWI